MTTTPPPATPYITIRADDPPSHVTGYFHLMGARSVLLAQAYGRVVVISILFTLAYAVIAIRAFDLMILQGALREDGKLSGGTNLVSTISTPRADILDRNGIQLATSIKTASLYADPKLILDPVAAAKGLAAIFPDMPYGEVLQKLQSDKRFVWLRRNLMPNEQAAILELGQPGLAFLEEYRRLYPQGPLAAHLVGYSDVDGHGLGGIEQGFNTLLSQNNDPVSLTIDIRLQHILRREMQKAISDFTAIGGAGVIMNAKTGEVLAAASLPDFDPHQAGAAEDAARFNRVTLGVYELGSTMKIFSTAAFLELNHGLLSSSFDTTQPIKIGRFTISDFHPEKRPLTLPEVFMYSSNIGTAKMAEQIGTDGLRGFYRDLGLLSPIAFDLPEVGKPLYPSPWRDINTLTASYGHGIAITPLQLAAATATVIGTGATVQPRLILNDTHANKLAKPEFQVVSEETAATMRRLLRLVVTHGTGGKADVPGLMIGGKTGTAEKNINGRYQHKSLISSFVGAFPIEDPQYIVLVCIDEPKPNKSSYGYATAGWVAAPTVGRIAASMAAVLGLSPLPTDTPDPAKPLEAYLAEFKDAQKIPAVFTTGAKPLASLAVDTER